MEKRTGKITDCRPGEGFPAVSVTGERCDLMCGHCEGSYLKSMACATDPGMLCDIARSVFSEGGAGILISGGCDEKGRVPLTGFQDAMVKISDIGLEMNVHAGFMSPGDVRSLVSAGVRRFSVDVHGDQRIISGILHLDRTIESYSELIDVIRDARGVPVAHLTVGLSHEDFVRSAQMIREKGMKDVVLLALIHHPDVSTDFTEASEEDVVSAAATLVGMGMDVTLGCMRDRRMRSLEVRCMEVGVRRIANMSNAAIKWAEDHGYHVEHDPRCCCMGIGSDERLLPL